MILPIFLFACSQTNTVRPTSTITIQPTETKAPSATPTRTEPPTPTLTPSPSPTPTRTLTPTYTPSQTPTMVALEGFSSKLLRPGVEPVAYLQNQCQFLQNRWSPEASRPGTVVLPIMIHSIAQNGSDIADPNRDITGDQFTRFVNYARYLGFETITTQQLLDFLDTNAKIPPRSMLMIVDDRRPGVIRDWIMPVLEEYGWTVTAAYIADPFSLTWAWDLMENLYSTGRMDVQSHGYTGQVYIVDQTPLDKIQNEIWNSTPVLEEHFGVRPIAFIWPGGNFTPLSVQVAREGGYELGFSAYSRGPILFNWVPLGAQERAVNDPRMVLPRAWSSAANANLDEAIKIGKQAADFAEVNFPAEAEWFRSYCGGEINQP